MDSADFETLKSSIIEGRLRRLENFRFDRAVDFQFVSGSGELSFTDCLADDQFVLQGGGIGFTDLLFEQCHFKGDVSLEGFRKIQFKQCRFEGNVSITGNENALSLLCEIIVLTKGIQISKGFQVVQMLNVRGDKTTSIALEKVASRKVSFLGVQALVSITNSTIDGNLIFRDCDLFSIRYLESRISESKVNGNFILNATTWDKLRISECHFAKLVQVLTTRKSHDLIFSYCTTNEEFEIKEYRTTAAIRLEYCTFQGDLSLVALRCKELKYIGNKHFGRRFFSEVIINEATTDTFRMFKDYYQSIKNTKDTQYFRTKELEALHKEADGLNDYVVLTLNRWSNHYGTKWTTGVKFTLGIGFILFTFYVWSLGEPFFSASAPHKQAGFLNQLHVWLINFIRFIGLTHDLDFMKDYRPNAGSFLIDYTARIFVGYGVYQTAAAFRKYGKSD